MAKIPDVSYLQLFPLVFAPLAINANAGDFSLLPAGVYENKFSVVTSTEYNTNPALRAGAEKGVWQLSVIPTYKLSNFDDLNELYGDFSLRVIRSSDKAIVIDREDPIANLGWNRQLERGNLGVKMHYEEASSRTTGFDESGIVFNDITRVNRSINANWQYQLSERLVLSTNADLNKSLYQGGAGSLVGSTNKMLGSNLNYAINERLRAVAQLSFSKFIPDSDQDPTNNLNYNAGLDWAFNERTDLGFRFGKNKLSGQNSGSGWNGSANYNYQTEHTTTRLEASRSVSPSGLGALISSDRYSATWSYVLSEKANVGLNYSFNKNKGINATESTQYGANYSYAISDLWRLGVTATYREIDNITSTTDAKVLGFNFTYDHPVF